MRLVALHQITGTLRLRSGLHIGAGKDTVEIGGLDQPIIKDPVTLAPYIPGSSLKGKMRSMLETSLFMDRPLTRQSVLAGKPCTCGKRDCPICTLFGAHLDVQKCDPNLGPTRLLVRDATLTEAYMRMHRNGSLPMEIKNENTINRVQGTAKDPRPLERVPAGTEFTLSLVLREYEGDDVEALVSIVKKGLCLIALDALGGGGSRGSGQVSFENVCLDNQPVVLNPQDVFCA